VIRRIGYPLALLALFVVAGGHWAVLQSVAWAGMIAEHAQTETLHQAVADTFDGAHPCALCDKIATTKKQAAPDASRGMSQELKCLFPATAPLPLLSAPRPLFFAGCAFRVPRRGEAPPTPPPRSLV
jgi:hypothetical protein